MTPIRSSPPAETPRRLSVVCGADETYVPHLAAMLHSLVQTLAPGWGVDVYVLNSGISAATQARLSRFVPAHRPDAAVHWVEADLGDFTLPKTLDYISTATYLRLLAPNLLPHLDRAIYLDCDLIVTDDLSRLWQTPLHRASTGAVQDFGIPYLGAPYGVVGVHDLGLNPQEYYFNSGVMLMDLAAWRSKRVGERCFDYLKTYAGQHHMGDQEALNAVLAGDWIALDARWNVTTEFFHMDPVKMRRPVYGTFADSVDARRDRLTRAPGIVHYTSRSKPWHPDCAHPQRHRYLAHRRASGWSTVSEAIGWAVPFALQRAWWRLKTSTRRYRMHVPGLHRPATAG